MKKYPWKVRFSSPHFHWGMAERHAVEAIVESGWVSNWEYVGRLEAHFRKKFSVPFALACTSATQGLTLAIKACGWNGLRVLLPAFTWPSTLFALEMNNCTPVFGDISRGTWLLAPKSAQSDFDAALPVDIFGNQASCPSGVPAIVDAAHGYGLPRLGHRGLVEVVSLSSTKIPTACEGGIILTRDSKIAEKLTEYRRLASRMTEISAVIALQSIRSYNRLEKERLKIVETYCSGLQFPFKLQRTHGASNISVFALYLKEPEQRELLYQSLCRIGVESKVYYDPLISGLPETDRLYARILALPVYPGIRPHLSRIIHTMNAAARGWT